MHNMSINLQTKLIPSPNHHSSQEQITMLNGDATKPKLVPRSKSAQIRTNILRHLPMILRWTSLAATATAAIIMGLNKQTKTTVVAIVGTKPIYQTFNAKFQQSPAFVYFVIANAIASLYNIVMVLVRPYFKVKRNNLWIHILDLVVMAMLATGAASSASVAELGKHGNIHTRWNPICNKFNSFCLQGGLAIIASFIGLLLYLLLNIISLISLHTSLDGQDLVV